MKINNPNYYAALKMCSGRGMYQTDKIKNGRSLKPLCISQAQSEQMAKLADRVVVTRLDPRAQDGGGNTRYYFYNR